VQGYVHEVLGTFAVNFDREFYEKKIALPKPYWDAQFRMIVEELDFAENDSILDVGCGVGYYVHKIGPLVKGACVGVDLSINALRLGSRQQRAEDTALVAASIEYLPFKENAFSRILCNNVIEHVPNYRRALFEMARVLENSGRIMIITPNKQMFFPLYMVVRWWIDRKAGHLWRFSCSALEHLLRSNGLDVNTVRYGYNVFGLLNDVIGYAINRICTGPFPRKALFNNRISGVLNALDLLSNNSRLIHFSLVATKNEL
jgi:SAM-dependent methyltransferase